MIYCAILKVVLIIFILTETSSQRDSQYSSVPESSPCTQVFNYEVENSVPGRWYALIHLTTDVTLYGVWLNVILDKQADALASSFGDVTSLDNRDFKLENTKQVLTPSTPLHIRIYVNYNSINTAPKLRSLRFNGREICAVGFQSITTQENQNRNTNVYNGYFATSTARNHYGDFSSINFGVDQNKQDVTRRYYESQGATNNVRLGERGSFEDDNYKTTEYDEPVNERNLNANSQTYSEKSIYNSKRSTINEGDGFIESRTTPRTISRDYESKTYQNSNTNGVTDSSRNSYTRTTTYKNAYGSRTSSATNSYSGTMDKRDVYDSRTNSGSNAYNSGTNNGRDAYNSRTSNDDRVSYSSRINNDRDRYDPETNNDRDSYNSRTNNNRDTSNPRTNNGGDTRDIRTNVGRDTYNSGTNVGRDTYNSGADVGRDTYNSRTNNRDTYDSTRTNNGRDSTNSGRDSYSSATNNGRDSYNSGTNNYRDTYDSRTNNNRDTYDSTRTNNGRDSHNSRTNNGRDTYNSGTNNGGDSYNSGSNTGRDTYSSRTNGNRETYDSTRTNNGKDTYDSDRETGNTRTNTTRDDQGKGNGNNQRRDGNRSDEDIINMFALSNVGGGRRDETNTRGYQDNEREHSATPHSREQTDRESDSSSGRASALSPSLKNNNKNSRGTKNKRGTSSASTQTQTQDPRASDNRDDSAEDYDSSRPNHKEDSSNDYFEGDHNIPDNEKINPTPISTNSNDDNETPCGKVASRPVPLIVGGDIAKEGQYPWHVALYQSQTVDSKYICGGSLVTLNHVLTAAHCVTRKATARAVNPQTLTIYLGRYNLRRASEGVQIKLVRRIFVHPEYNATNFFADLAVMKLNRQVEYSNVVRPVCLWRAEDKDLSSVIGKEGSVVGWGFDENDNLQEDLAVVQMPVVKQTTCLWSFKEFFSHFTSNQSYCAGYANGTSVCNGDSGGGMIFPIRDHSSNTPTWYLRGMVSISVARQNDSTCDPHHYVVFTDIAQYLDWISHKLT